MPVGGRGDVMDFAIGLSVGFLFGILIGAFCGYLMAGNDARPDDWRGEEEQ